jgi:hypothetical protein
VRAASRGSVLAAAAIAATGLVAVTPTVSRLTHVPPRSTETRLVDFTDIPVNLFNDIVNIPFNELQGFDVLSNSLFFSGDWWVPSAVNLWGTDPGDLGHYMGLLDVLIPFSAISGLDQPEIDPTADAAGLAGLAQQIGLFAAAELPVSASCDAETCYPMTPPNIVTGSTGFDRDIGFIQALFGQATDAHNEPFGLFSNWFQVQFAELANGTFTFGSGDPGIIDPSPGTGTDPLGAVPSGYGFFGTTDPTAGNAGYMPWDGINFKLNLLGPFENFFNSLLADPSSNPIEIPTITEIGQAFQNFVAGSVIAFDPFLMGSPACPALCDIPFDETQTALVQDVLAWDPSNTTIQAWLDGANNNATLLQQEAAVALLQTGQFNLSYDNLLNYDALLAQINPELPYLFTNDGIVTDPNYMEFASGVTTDLDPVYGGLNSNLVINDWYTLLTNDKWDLTPLLNINTLYYFVDPASQNVMGPPIAAAAETLTGGSAASELTSDLSALLASMGGTAAADALSAVFSEISAQISADLAAFVPQSILSMF